MSSNIFCPICGNSLKKRQLKYCSSECQHESMRGKRLKKETIEKMTRTRRAKSIPHRYSLRYYEHLYHVRKMSVIDISCFLLINKETLYQHFKRIGLVLRPQKKSIKSGTKNHGWKGGVHKSNGYLVRTKDKKKIHRSIVSRVIGRKLKRSEVVHHIDGDRSNNKNNNLLLCTNSYHAFLHRRMDILNNKPLFGRVSDV